MSPIIVPSVQNCIKNTHILISFPFISKYFTYIGKEILNLFFTTNDPAEWSALLSPATMHYHCTIDFLMLE